MTAYQRPDVLPGPAHTVRTLMSIGGPIGIVIGLLLGTMMLLIIGGLTALETLSEATDGQVAPLMGGVGAVGLAFALIPLVYGIASTTLARLMRRRSRRVFWGVVVFNVVALAFLLLMLLGGDGLSVVPLVVHSVMLGLMFAPRVRAFYGV
ncbi:hypothetical protein [Nocardiopsis sp. MG754419]|uniref:hypothetical protein n=1 Tax=Nocardiopsis sp. MG754419 TaxID=2259865 RepID=UPI001BA710D5|nr:hypothetical protein [Nocardiopsis sp. MG754419]MBR8741920.1 hypothetical protein [Nocardiopsis sp. MG754419]